MRDFNGNCFTDLTVVLNFLVSVEEAVAISKVSLQKQTNTKIVKFLAVLRRIH